MTTEQLGLAQRVDEDAIVQTAQDVKPRDRGVPVYAPRGRVRSVEAPLA